MKKIAICGAGGFGREVAGLIKKINEKQPQWELIGFFDPDFEKGTMNEYGIVLGGDDEINKYPDNLSIVLAIASPKIKEKIYKSVNNPKIEFPNIISPDLDYLDKDNVSLGKGNIICRGGWLSTNVHIGDFNILNVNITVGHDTTIGNYNSFMPNVNLSGEVSIKDRNYFGVGAIVIQQQKIGSDVTVGANSLVIKETKDGMTYVGSPAKVIIR
ncbi:MAG: acetyltransferase [Bacteroidales bacterium]|nr:acetyltransferase [Bacteroidales bacterium]